MSNRLKLRIPLRPDAFRDLRTAAHSIQHHIGQKMSRPVYTIAGGITKFAKAHPDKDFRLMVKEAFDYALNDLSGKLSPDDIDGSVISYFSDHFARQLKAGAMVQDYVGLCPKPNVR